MTATPYAYFINVGLPPLFIRCFLVGGVCPLFSRRHAQRLRLRPNSYQNPVGPTFRPLWAKMPGWIWVFLRGARICFSAPHLASFRAQVAQHHSPDLPPHYLLLTWGARLL